MLKKGKEYTLAVTGYGSDGAGVARLEGQVVFVHGALRGETCRAVIEHVGHRAAWARLLEVLSPSPARITPLCPHYGACGGCQTAHMTYEEELFFKKNRVEEALRRIGGLALPVEAILGGETEGYRNKVQFPAAPGPKLGFYRARSHAVTDVASCALQPAWANALRGALKDYMVRFDVPAYDERSRAGLVRHLFARGNTRGECVAAVVVNGGGLPHEQELVDALRAAAPTLLGVSLNENRRDTNVVLGPGWRTLWGESALTDSLRGVTFRLSLPAFYQVNHDQAEVLYGLVEELAGLTGSETLLDLYCGAGTIGLTLARRARRLLGAEIVPEAVRDAEENARRNGIQNARFLCADAAQVARELARSGEAVDVTVVDPPRKGLAPDVVESLLQIAPRRLVYVSCDPATLARDLGLLSAAYTPHRCLCVDLFPRTAHVETVCLLEKK